MTEPLFVFCPVCRRHVKRGPDTTRAVTLRRHKASVHGDSGWFCDWHDRFEPVGSYCHMKVERRRNGLG